MFVFNHLLRVDQRESLYFIPSKFCKNKILREYYNQFRGMLSMKYNIAVNCNLCCTQYFIILSHAQNTQYFKMALFL